MITILAQAGNYITGTYSGDFILGIVIGLVMFRLVSGGRR